MLMSMLPLLTEGAWLRLMLLPQSPVPLLRKCLCFWVLSVIPKGGGERQNSLDVFTATVSREKIAGLLTC